MPDEPYAALVIAVKKTFYEPSIRLRVIFGAQKSLGSHLGSSERAGRLRQPELCASGHWMQSRQDAIPRA